MTMLTASLEFVFKIVAAGIAAAVLHELTHWLVAKLGGREAWIEWRELNERHYYPLNGPGVIDRIVGIAPFAVGSLFGVGWVLAQLPISAPLIVGWGVYTLNGVPNDFRV